MCESIADGGRRCAGHTRPPFQAAMARVDAAEPANLAVEQADAMGEVTAHASTKTGSQEVEALRDQASAEGNRDRAAWLSSCLRLGESQRQAANEIRQAIRTARSYAQLGTVSPGDVLYLGEPHTQTFHNFVRRGTYVRVAEPPHPVTKIAKVEILAFRPGDANRARRGPGNRQVAFELQPGTFADIPVRQLVRPGSSDDSANFYRSHTVAYAGTYYTEEVAHQIIADEPDSDFHFHATFAPREGSASANAADA